MDTFFFIHFSRVIWHFRANFQCFLYKIIVCQIFLQKNIIRIKIMWKLKLNFLPCAIALIILTQEGLLWSWSYGSWIYNYLCNQCLSPLTLRVWTLLWWDVLDTTLCDKVCRWLATGLVFSGFSGFLYQ
jgi:hypothetical protein